jgi:pimeloyl-ACP methyl ester carboxylesterase
MPRRVLVAAVLLLLLAADTAAQSDPLAWGQQPGSRYFWTEHGPAQANGAIIWNHGMSGTTHSWSHPAPPAFRLLQARGWDVIMLKRHHGAENDSALYRTVQRTLQEVTALKKAGYRRVVLAGQSFGGYVTLEAADSSPDIDAEHDARPRRLSRRRARARRRPSPSTSSSSARSPRRWAGGSSARAAPPARRSPSVT